MTDFLKIAKSIAVHFAHICTYGVETVKINDIHSMHVVEVLVYIHIFLHLYTSTMRLKLI